MSARSVSRPLFAGIALLALACCPLAEQKTAFLHAAAAASAAPSVATPEPLQAVPGQGLLQQQRTSIVQAASPTTAVEKAVTADTGTATDTAPAASRSGLVLAGDDLTAGAAAEAALAFALEQLGKPYVWGAEGPDTFDCSGLTMRAYEAAGYQLPRTAAEQALVGTPVDVANLLPGDLLFYATDPSDLSTVHHVVMYAGAGMIVQAPHQGDVVRVDPMWLGDEYAGAVRIVDAAPALALTQTLAAAHPKRSAAPTKYAKPSPHPTPSLSPAPLPSAGTTPTPVVEPSAPASDLPPSEQPTVTPTASPTESPTESPTVTPTDTPTVTPTVTPTPSNDADLPPASPKTDPIVVQGS